MPIAKVILDLDHTLLDTRDFKAALAASLAPHGVAEEKFWGTYCQARDRKEGRSDYRFETHAELLAAGGEVDHAAVLAALRAVLARTEDFLFPDAKGFLSRLISLGVDTELVTRGDPEFQTAKIKASGIDKLVSDFTASDEKKSKIVREKIVGAKGFVYFVNDHLDETLEVAKEVPGLIPILKRRPDLSPERYLGLRMLNFQTLAEIADYLTIVHATHPAYAEQ